MIPLPEDREARLARTSRRAALVSAVGAVVVFASIGIGVVQLQRMDRELNEQIALKRAAVLRLHIETVETTAAKASIEAATRRAAAALAAKQRALARATSERQETEDLRDRIKAASDTNVCVALAKETLERHGPSGPSSEALESAPPRSPRARARAEWRKSQAALLKKDLRAAEQHLNDAIAADPTYPAAYNTLGRLKEARFDLVGAEQLYLEAYRRSPTYTPALQNLARVTELVRGRKVALGYAEELLQLRPTSDAVRALVLRLGGTVPAAPATAD